MGLRGVGLATSCSSARNCSAAVESASSAARKSGGIDGIWTVTVTSPTPEIATGELVKVEPVIVVIGPNEGAGRARFVPSSKLYDSQRSFQLKANADAWMVTNGNGSVGSTLRTTWRCWQGLPQMRISRPTLRKWWRRYQECGVEGLRSHARKTRRSPGLKRTESIVALILKLRKTRRMGARRLQSELLRHHETRLSLSTIHKILHVHGVAPLRRGLPKRKAIIRYNRPVPGDRVQMDTCKIAPGVHTAIDDYSRFRVLGVYSRRNAANAIDFVDRVIEEMPFAIQRIHTDRGLEFFAEKVQRRFMGLGIKFRSNKPRSPHLNGKVERSQQTDLHEFWAVVDLADPKLSTLLDEWQHFYNWDRPHGALHGKSPIDRVCELISTTPLAEEVSAAYDASPERIRHQEYAVDLRIAATLSR
jgi:transposase InsO family protein